MMEELYSALLQLGLGGGILAVFWLVLKPVIKHFTDTISTDRKLMAEMTADFSKVLGNHVDHATKEQAHSRAVIEQQGKIIDRNTDALNRVGDLLCKYNSK